ncbi:probable peroxisomal acyl-coenzyme A oxidase 1 [Maniola jurtina]|uniref:probable peroxisomal acyl-coenzyme A oxidase 1 n=1 Tax=Maniola jurtina TaxID=191418 RepID=UPI001E6881F0|nr:probable peroxisomal acyl-coenzyme A oxidase 1 [Maniola jurtina]
MANKKVNEDLLKERAKCNFNVEELTNLLDDGADCTKWRRTLEQNVLSVKGLLDVVPEEYLSHKEKYENSVRKSLMMIKALKVYNKESASRSFEENMRLDFRNSLWAAVTKDITPLLLHLHMFMAAIIGQGNDEQREYWEKKAANSEIIGTYAQTELGHGTFIRGLETRATYDVDTEEFVLHSPTLTAYKWWPGGMGHTANYCVVMAQLYIKGNNYGIQPFMVQIRDEETHMPLPGVKVGEVGPKMGFNTANNGFLGFDNVRIPRNWMLMKNAQVLKDGTFKASPNSKLVYGTMVNVRVIIVNNLSKNLAQAATIAVRYSAIRRQSQPKPGAPEPQIIDYVTQQHKLLIAIATSHAYHFTARWLWDRFTKINEELRRGEFKNLPELHILACSMKVISTADCSALIEKCRLACGGHGYMMSSNLPHLYGISVATVTYEGENTVLLLQVARSLAKTWDQIYKGHISVSPSMLYLADKTPLPEWDNSLQGILKNFERVAKGKVSTSISSLDKYRKSGLSPEDAWNKASVQLIAAAEAHARVILLSVYKTEIERRASTLSAPLATVLHQLLEMYYIYWTLERIGDFLLYTKLTASDVRDLQHRYEDLLEKIRPNAVGLVDAFDFRDEILNSTLGAYDGRAYERLMEEALKSPLNAEPVNQDLQHRYEDLLEKIRPNAVGLVDAFDFRDEILNSTLGAYDGRAYERLMEEALKSPLNAEPVNQSFEKYLKPFMQGKL